VAIFGISDLHLSFSTDKPMDVFGPEWRDHATRMAEAWDAIVGDDDVVLCPGDLSWAMRLGEAERDLAWIGARKGRLKVLGRGNHDYWWSAIGKVRAALPSSCVAIQHDAVDLGDVVVCGSRGWAAPGALDWSDADEKIYAREVIRLRTSIEAGRALAGDRPLIVALHYPPFTARGAKTALAELVEQSGAAVCVYGHLHGRHAHRTAVEGDVAGVRYRLIACDRLQFRPVQVWPFVDDGLGSHR